MAKFRSFPAPTWSNMVQTELQASIFLEINVALTISVLKSISEVFQMAKFGPFLAPTWTETLR